MRFSNLITRQTPPRSSALLIIVYLVGLCNTVVALPLPYSSPHPGGAVPRAPAAQAPLPAMAPRPAIAPQRPIALQMQRQDTASFGLPAKTGNGIASAMKPYVNSALNSAVSRSNVLRSNFANSAAAEKIANWIVGGRLPGMPAGSTITFGGKAPATNSGFGRTSMGAPGVGRTSEGSAALAAIGVGRASMGQGKSSPGINISAGLQGSSPLGGSSAGRAPSLMVAAEEQIPNGAASKRGSMVPLGASASSKGRLPGVTPPSLYAASGSGLSGGRGSGGQSYAQIAAIAGKPVPGTPGAAPAFTGEHPAMKQMPSFNTMYQRLNPVVGNDEVIFFTGNTRAAAQRLQDQGCGTLITDLLRRGGIDETVVNRISGTKNDNGNEFFARAGAALGQAAKRNIKVTMPTDFGNDGSSFFEKWELPFLKSNPNVREIRGLMYRSDGAGGWAPAGERVLYSNPNMAV